MWVGVPNRGSLSVCALTCAIVLAGADAHAATISVPAGGDLQAAINAAQGGDVIVLQPGATYIGNFVLPNKIGVTTPIVIRSAAADSLLPPAGVRITPAYAAHLPKLKSPNSVAALRTATGAHHWTLRFLEFQANAGGYGEIISLGAADTTQTQLSQVPYDLVLDRVYVHGDRFIGQKRGIGLNSRDTTIVNSYVSDCKLVGQDSQAIASFNGPGNYLIENNYIEGAAENLLFGGSDPPIQNLVATNVVIRRNHMPKPIAWREPLLAAPANVSATPVAGGGGLASGTYYYKVAARLTTAQGAMATSATPVQVSATVGNGGSITISWAAVAGAEDYLVYGRAAGAQNQYWRTTSTFFTDTGAAGTSGAPVAAARWVVKNSFELKNAQDVLVEGNVFENVWVGGQSGFPIVFTPRNQDGRAPWSVVQRVMFRRNLIRHSAGGVSILGRDDNYPSLLTNRITIEHNLFEDMTDAWGAGSKFLQMGNGGDTITVNHNTVIAATATVVWIYGSTPVTNVVFTNNMLPHNGNGIIGEGYGVGSATIAAHWPSSIFARNVIAGATASRYPAGNFYPPEAEWQAEFVNYAQGDYRLHSNSTYLNAGTDSIHLGADINAVKAQAASALSGDNRLEAASVGRVQILTSSLPNAQYLQSYAQLIQCTTGTGPCAWVVSANSLPAGLTFDAVAGVVSGTPTTIANGSLTLEAYDPLATSNRASATLSLVVDPPPFTVTVPPAPQGRIGVEYQLALLATGAVGTPGWSLVGGALPPGLWLEGSTGRIRGTPSAAVTASAIVQAQDSWGSDRTAQAPVTITISSNVPPSVSLTSPASGGSYSTSDTVSMAASAADSDGSVARVEFFAGTTLLGQKTAAPYTFSWAGPPAGTHTLTARAFDNGGAFTTSTGIQVTVQGPTAPSTGSHNEIVMYAARAVNVTGAWLPVADPQAAAGVRLQNSDFGAPKTSALASPAHYFELTFQADANKPYRLWLRGKALNDHYDNDAVSIQFDGSVDVSGAPVNRIGTTASESVVLEECSGCGVQGWGWTDNGYGADGLPIYFATTGTQRLRVQVRQDGLGIDQIVLSAISYRSVSPGSAKNDTTILPETAPPPPPNTPPVVTLTTPAAGASFAAPASVTLTATASDADGSVARVEFYAGASLLGTDTSAPYAWVWNNVAAGRYTLTARAVDAAGATADSASIAIDVTSPPPPPLSNMLPNVTLTSPLDGASYAGPAKLTLAASASDADGRVVRVEFYSNGALIGTATSSSSSFAVTVSGVGAGEYTITARAVDDAGASAVSAAATIVVAKPGNGKKP